MKNLFINKIMAMENSMESEIMALVGLLTILMGLPVLLSILKFGWGG
ncbi:hypothetical protein GCM10027347_59650 [Larkinella harenae]